uniref:C2H2-type domain-containing protein n=1 Tax=Glossina pallidipes TaxID=7398 RepID=A0A1B0AHS0_GLOPL
MSNKNYRNNTAPEGYWTILETVPYSLANAGTNGSTSTVSNVISSSTEHQHNGATTIHMATHHPEQHQHHITDANDPTSLIASANVVVEIPSESVGIPGSTIQYQYTIPKSTTAEQHQIIRRVTTNSAALAIGKMPTAQTPTTTTIQIVKQNNNIQQHHHHHHHQQQQQQSHQARITTTGNIVQHDDNMQQLALQECLETSNVVHQHQHHQQHQQISSAQTAQEFIKINTSRLEDKMLLRNVVQYETATSNQATATGMQSTTTATQATILINDGHSNKLLNPKSEQVHDHEEQLLLQEVAAAAVAVAASDTHIAENDDNAVPDMKVLHQDTINTNDMENEKFLAPNKRCKSNTKPSEMASAGLQYVCNVCGKSYKIKGSLKRHKSYECGVAPTLPCPYCLHKCKYKSDLRKHISQKHAATVANSSSSNADNA